MSETFRRVAAVFLALTFVVGQMPYGLRAADAGVQMVTTAASDTPMSGKCDGCGDDQKAMAAAACSAFCAGFIALPSIEAALELLSAEAFDGLTGPLLTGHTVLPDPYPPRPAILS